MDWDSIRPRLRHEIDTALNIVSELLQDLGATYAYAKGSALKTWDSSIDYVPVISDLDIYVFHPAGLASVTLDQSLGFLTSYESQYASAIPDAIHLPRIQLLDIGALYDQPDVVPPREDQVTALFGAVELADMPPVDRITEIDKAELQSLQEFINQFPLMLIDRTGQEQWVALRRLTWRVSPTPIRLLSQTYDDPVDLWGWNRSRIVSLLESNEYSDVATSYSSFYHTAWELFSRDFNSTELYHQLYRQANEVFVRCVSHLSDLTAE